MARNSITKRLSPITHIPSDRLVEKPPCPVSVKIELTPNCNYKCGYCPLTQRNGYQPKPMDLDLFKDITEDMKASGVTEIGPFLIGEPFAAPHPLIDAIYYLKHRLEMPYVFLTSNASLAKREYVDECMKAGLDSLKWSVNAADGIQFEKLMGVKSGLFVQALNNIRFAWETRLASGHQTALYASSILYGDDQRALMTPVLEMVKQYVDEHYWLPLYSMGGKTKEREAELGYQPIAGNQGSVADPVDPIPCWTLFTAAHVLSDGRMTACCADGSGYWVVGDLKKQSFMDCWHSDEFVELRRAHIKGEIRGSKCEKCALAG